MKQKLIPPVSLFRFSVPCRYRKRLWSERGVRLAPAHWIPSFGELEGKKPFAELRAAWNLQGLVFQVRVSGKRQSVWCRESRLEESDGLHVWIDTRDTHTIHRASHYCHRFAFLPEGSGDGYHSPTAEWLPINRAKDDPVPVRSDVLKVQSEFPSGGYTLNAHIPSSALTGFDPEEYPRLGFTYALIDRELGWQTFSVGPELPFAEDPSLWGTLELLSETS